MHVQLIRAGVDNRLGVGLRADFIEKYPNTALRLTKALIVRARRSVERRWHRLTPQGRATGALGSFGRNIIRGLEAHFPVTSVRGDGHRVLGFCTIKGHKGQFMLTHGPPSM